MCLAHRCAGSRRQLHDIMGQNRSKPPQCAKLPRDTLMSDSLPWLVPSGPMKLALPISARHLFPSVFMAISAPRMQWYKPGKLQSIRCFFGCWPELKTRSGASESTPCSFDADEAPSSTALLLAGSIQKRALLHLPNHLSQDTGSVGRAPSQLFASWWLWQAATKTKPPMICSSASRIAWKSPEPCDVVVA